MVGIGSPAEESPAREELAFIWGGAPLASFCGLFCGLVFAPVHCLGLFLEVENEAEVQT